MSISDKQFKTLHKGLNMGGKMGGFTVNAQTGKAAISGVVVANAKGERQVPASVVSAGSIKDYHADNRETFHADPKKHLGGWNPGGGKDVSLDTPRVLTGDKKVAAKYGDNVAKADAMTSALDIGIQQKQDAVFRLDDNQTVKTGINADKERRNA